MTSIVRRPVTLPLGLVVMLLLLVVVAAIQGLGAARDRQEMLRPHRAMRLVLRPGEVAIVQPAPADQLLVLELGDRPATRLGLYQMLPERTLVRWIEPGASSSTPHLVLPLAGLADGRYAVTRHGDDESATTRNMDRPPEELDIVGEFQLQRR